MNKLFENFRKKLTRACFSVDIFSLFKEFNNNIVNITILHLTFIQKSTFLLLRDIMLS